MASIQKTRNGTWRVQIEHRGRREYKTLATKALATIWANQREAELARGLIVTVDEAQRTPFSEVVKAYRDTVLPGKRNRSYKFVLNTLEAEFGRTRLLALHAKDVAKFRNRREKEVAPATVVKELNLLRYLIDHAIDEMNIHLPENVARRVRNPEVNNERDRIFMADEEARLFQAFPNDNYRNIGTLALETACRLGELLKMRWQDIDFAKRTLALPKEHTKTDTPRRIPLSTKALAVLRSMPRPVKGGRVFSCWARGDSFENGYRRAVQRARAQYEAECNEASVEPHPALLVDLRFHDFRHIATSRLAKVFPNVIELSRVTGHTDLKMLARYYHTSAEELASRLA